MSILNKVQTWVDREVMPLFDQPLESHPVLPNPTDWPVALIAWVAFLLVTTATCGALLGR